MELPDPVAFVPARGPPASSLTAPSPAGVDVPVVAVVDAIVRVSPEVEAGLMIVELDIAAVVFAGFGVLVILAASKGEASCGFGCKP